VDAIIIQDLGLARLAHAICPQVEIHASTQMTVTSPEGLAFVETLVPLGRVVLARELSLKEIARFRESVPQTARLHLKTPLEVFVHGALCVAYSGQCLTSEALGQRSANRGECAQACRMPYEIVVDGVTRDLGEVRYLLSPQDLAAVDLVPELVRAGVTSFKIEGRLKAPEYVAAVTRIYRKALDACRVPGPPEAALEITAGDRYALEMTFSRGLSTGWLAGENHPYLTHGRFGKKRGPLLGTIAAAGHGWIRLADRTAIPIAPGDGVVFDAGENRDLEQGARIWKIEGDLLIFHRTYSGINFERIKPGHTLYKTSDPKLESEIRRFWQNARPAPRKTPLYLTASGRPGQPLALTAFAAPATASAPNTIHLGPAGRNHHQEAAGRMPAPPVVRAFCPRPGGAVFGANGTVWAGEPLAEVASAQPLEPAAKHPLTTATLLAQLGRTGDTEFELAALDNQLEGACHLALSALNTLRRDLLAKVAAAMSPPPARGLTAVHYHEFMPALPTASAPLPTRLAVLCRTLDQLAAALAAGVETLYCDFEDPRRYREAVASVRTAAGGEFQPAIHLATPRILKPGELGYLKLIDHAAPDGLLLRNLGALHYYRERADFVKIGDFSLNVANPITARMIMEQAGLAWLTVSYDLNINQVLDLLAAAPPEWFELTLHQHMPLFHMQHCVFCAFLSTGTTYLDCGRPCEHHVVHLRDRVGLLHRLQADVGCRNTLFNGKAQTGARYFPDLRATGLFRFRLELLDEPPDAATQTIRAYQQLLREQLAPAALLGQVQALEKLGVTEGSLARR
jgi:putative protease